MLFRRLFLICLLILPTSQLLADNIIINGTRFVYPANDREISVELSNRASSPALAQVWIDDGDDQASPEDINAPFIITPPVSRIEAGQGQTIRIQSVATGLPTDRESIFFLNVLDIPPSPERADDRQNYIQLAIRSRMKIFYRPPSLGSREQANSRVSFSGQGTQLTIKNDSPFYLTLRDFKQGGQSLTTSIHMVAPFSDKQVSVDRSLQSGATISFGSITDFGSITEHSSQLR